VEAHNPGSARLGRRARKTAYLTAGVAVSATLIAGSLSGLNVHVLGFTDWPILPDDGPASQVLPDPARGETIARLETGGGRPAVLAIPGKGAPRIVAAGQLAPDGSPLAGLIVDGEPLTDGGRAINAGRGGIGEPVATSSNADADGDGLSDAAEQLLGTNPLRGDSDGDGIPDAYEVENRMNPRMRADASADLDGDGVSNRSEYLVRANPRVSDSNGDGIPDGQDDSDGDGLPNAVEDRLGLNPAESISQAGAVPAPPAKSPAKTGGENATVTPTKSEAVGTSPAKPAMSDGDRDSDDDGFTNAAEIAAGTDPADPKSKPLPPVEEPPVEEPPVEEPPVEEPPVEEPPVEEPPVEEPPVEQPPVEQPPVEQPPVEQPPVEQPPPPPPPAPEPVVAVVEPSVEVVVDVPADPAAGV
jgi:hypothetical protein